MTPCPHAPPGPHAESEAERPGAPRNVVVVLLDSLNRHMLGSYGGTEFATPHLDAFARERAVRFTSHVTGSLPCMPARHDILCGSLDFLWRPWGSIEIWEEPITAQLRRAGVTTMLVSDHPHLFEVGGENYHTDFSAWDYTRGHEGDPWRTYPDPSYIGAPALPARGGGWFWRDRLGWAEAEDRAYDRSRHVLPGRGGLPGTADDAHRGGLVARRRARRRPLPAVRGRVRPPRAVRHARALGRALRPGLGGRAAHLAPLRRRRGGPGAPERAGGPAHPGQLRRQAQHDRPLGGRGVRRAQRARPVGQHGGHRVHGPWALSRREGHLGQAGCHAVRAARPHAAAGALAGGPRRDRVRRAHDQRRHPRHGRRRVRRAAARGHARRVAGAPVAGRGRAQCGSGPSGASTGTGCR